jgi:hypothetical protein
VCVCVFRCAYISFLASTFEVLRVTPCHVSSLNRGLTSKPTRRHICVVLQTVTRICWTWSNLVTSHEHK